MVLGSGDSKRTNGNDGDARNARTNQDEQELEHSPALIGAGSPTSRILPTPAITIPTTASIAFPDSAHESEVDSASPPITSSLPALLGSPKPPSIVIAPSQNIDFGGVTLPGNMVDTENDAHAETFSGGSIPTISFPAPFEADSIKNAYMPPTTSVAASSPAGPGFFCSALDQRYITIDDPGLGQRFYHELHFFCGECGTPFLDPSCSSSAGPEVQQQKDIDNAEEQEENDQTSAFVIHGRHAFCPECDIKLHRSKCRGCKMPIRDEEEAIEAMKIDTISVVRMTQSTSARVNHEWWPGEPGAEDTSVRRIFINQHGPLCREESRIEVTEFG
ncbi:hypothetical protein QFC19_006657 [Naganishia cerealis]|uniref:Uncharacterized protein n=1 Tax=Naganishia cerealis TaxID=610337 RepID=A0ACC2VFC6_9TREE|nr:hypothetical protein QFC19_006657 [Naganishia cerealis]